MSQEGPVLVVVMVSSMLCGSEAAAGTAADEGASAPRPASEASPEAWSVGARPGEVRTHSAEGLAYVWIPPGTFEMGCVPGDSDCRKDEKPRHGVTLSRGFWLGRTEVTVGAYRRFASATGREMPPAPGFNAGWRHEDHPIVNVSWYDSVAYCEWAGGRLATEAEWEYAARGGREGLKYPWGDGISHENANYFDTRGRDRWVNTAPVGSFAASRFGLHDMAGNVYEWCADWKGYYGTSSSADPRGTWRGQYRILRGGTWGYLPTSLRASSRYGVAPPVRSSFYGLRCVRDGRLP